MGSLNLVVAVILIEIFAPQTFSEEIPSFALQAIDVGSNEHYAPSHKRQSGQITIVGGVPDPSAGMLYLSDPLSAINAPVVAVDDGVDLVADDAPVVMASGPSLFSVQRPILEPMQLPPVVDVYPEVPDRVGDTPLQVQTVIEAEPNPDEQQLDVPWVWDDKVCSPLLNRAAPPAGPLTSEQVTFALPLVIREGKRLKLKTRSGAVSPLHSEEAAGVFERLFWCITALIARVREPDERSRLMKKLYEDYLLWMEEDVIPVFNRTDLRRAYKWIKKKDESEWVVPEKRYYDSGRRSKHRRESEKLKEEKEKDRTILIIFILIFIIIVLIILYYCIVKKKKIVNLWCFCVCERCRKGKGGKCQEEERKPLTVQKDDCGGGTGGVGEPKKTYIYRSSSWSSNSSLQPPCPPEDPPPCP